MERNKQTKTKEQRTNETEEKQIDADMLTKKKAK